METTAYLESINLIERLHRHFMDVLKAELDKNQIQDINNVQSMILYNIGDDELTVGELTVRGYYLGSNVSYNVKKMVEKGYLDQERSVHDKRSVRVKLSKKGKKLHNLVSEMFAKHQVAIDDSDIEKDSLVEMNDMLKRIERFWSSSVSFTGGF